MKRFLIAVITLLCLPISSHAHPRSDWFECSDLDDSTVGMSLCTLRKIKTSDEILKKRLTRQNFQKWKELRRKVCFDAYGWKPELKGTLHPLNLDRCNAWLNKALIDGSSSIYNHLK